MQVTDSADVHTMRSDYQYLNSFLGLRSRYATIRDIRRRITRTSLYIQWMVHKNPLDFVTILIPIRLTRVLLYRDGGSENWVNLPFFWYHVLQSTRQIHDLDQQKWNSVEICEIHNHYWLQVHGHRSVISWTKVRMFVIQFFKKFQGTCHEFPMTFSLFFQRLPLRLGGTEVRWLGKKDTYTIPWP